MSIVPKELVSHTQIEAGVKKAAQALAADVVRIRYSLGSDWSGDPSIFFRVVVTDNASRKAQLRDLAQNVARTLNNEVKVEELGLHSYFNFRSLSEQATLEEPAWT